MVVAVISPKIRKQIFARDGGCVVAGSAWGFLYPCRGPWTVQHRKARGMGGSKTLDTVDNLLTMCEFHNQLDMSNADFRVECYWRGWSIPRFNGGVIPQVIPVKYVDGWFLLTPGGRVGLDEAKALRTMDELYRGLFGGKSLPTH